MSFDVQGRVVTVFRVRSTGRADFSPLPGQWTGQNMEAQHTFRFDGWRASESASATTSAGEQSAGAAYSQGRRRELQLPAVFSQGGPHRRRDRAGAEIMRGDDVCK